jgi:hypothetical protein
MIQQWRFHCPGIIMDETHAWCGSSNSCYPEGNESAEMTFQCWERNVESGKVSAIYGTLLGSASDGNNSSEVGRVGQEREKSSDETDTGVVVQCY